MIINPKQRVVWQGHPMELTDQDIQNSLMIIKQKIKPLLQWFYHFKIMNYPCFEPFKEIFACSTEREGGVSEGLYKSLNLCDYVEDELHNVERNCFFCKQHGIERENLIFPRQTHGNRIQIIDDKFRAKRNQTNSRPLRYRWTYHQRSPNLHRC